MGSLRTAETMLSAMPQLLQSQKSHSENYIEKQEKEQFREAIILHKVIQGKTMIMIL
jgi:hypothetical protein